MIATSCRPARNVASLMLVMLALAGCGHGMGMRHGSPAAGMSSAGMSGQGCCAMCSMMGGRQAMQPGSMQPGTMQPGTMQPGTMQPGAPAAAGGRLVPPMQMAAAGPMCGADGASCGAAAGAAGCPCCGATAGDRQGAGGARPAVNR